MLGGPSVNKPCSLAAPTWGSPPRVQVLLLWFLRFVSSNESQARLSLFFPPLPACSSYPVWIMRHEITASLDFWLPCWRGGTPVLAWSGDPSVQTHRRSQTY